MKCNQCRYYTGEHIHGHGECWGECNLLEFLYKEIESNKQKITSDLIDTICFDNTECHIAKGIGWEVKKK